MAERTDDFEFWPAETSSGPTGSQAVDIKLGSSSAGFELRLEPNVMPLVTEAAIGIDQSAAALPEGAALIQSSERPDLNSSHTEHRVELALHLPMDMNLQQPLVAPGAATAGNRAMNEEQAFSKAGYEHNFYDRERAAEFNCQICLSVAQDPQQTKCCGTTFCLYCIERALKSSKAGQCPICNTGAVELIPDKAQRQKINKLKVQCPIENCAWIVDLADIEAHTKKPHPLSPPLSTPYSTLQRNQQGQSQDSWEETQQLRFNTLPAHPRKEQPKSRVGLDQPVPVPNPQTLKPESEGDDTPIYINASVFLPPTGQGEHNESAERDNFNLTFPRPPRPRVPRTRSQSPLQDAKRVKVSPYVNLGGPDLPFPQPPHEVPFNQPPLPPQDQTREGSSSEAHEREASIICDNPTQLTSETDYLNAPLKHRAPPIYPPPTSQASQEVECLPSQPTTISEEQQLPQSNRRPSGRPQLYHQLPYLPQSDHQLPYQVHSYQNLPDMQPIDRQPLPLDQIPSTLVSVANKMDANLPTSTAQDELSYFQFPVPSAENAPNYFNVHVAVDPCETAHIPHIEIETETSEDMPPLPPDLLALLDDQTPPQEQVENPFADDDAAGFVLSPSPPSRLPTPLLPVPLLDLLQPTAVAAAEPPTQPLLAPLLPHSTSPSYENTQIPNVAEPPPAQHMSEAEYINMSHEAYQQPDYEDYENAARLQQMGPSQPLSSTPYENVLPLEGANEPNPSPLQQADNIEMSRDPNQPDHFIAASFQQIESALPEPISPQPQGTNDASSPTQQLNEANTSHFPQEEDYVNTVSPVQRKENGSEYLVFVSQPQANEENTTPPQSPVTSQPDYINVHEPLVTHSPEVSEPQAEYVDMQTPSVSQPQTVRTDVSQPLTVYLATSQAEAVDALLPTECGDVSQAEARETPARLPVSQHQPLPSRSPSPQYETIPVLPEPDVPDEHVYEAVPPNFPPPPPPSESPPPSPPALPQAGAALPTPPGEVDVPPPPLPPRSDLPAAQQGANTPPPVAPRTRTPTPLPAATVEPPQAQVAPQQATVQPPQAQVAPQQATVQPPQPQVAPQQATVQLPQAQQGQVAPQQAEVAPQQAEVAPSQGGPAQQPRTEAENLAEAADDNNDHILQEIRQGNANDPFVDDIPPPQYADLSQRYDRQVFTPPPAHHQPPQSPQGAFIIQNNNARTVTPVVEGPLRIENVNIQYERGANVDHRNKAVRKTQIIL